MKNSKTAIICLFLLSLVAGKALGQSEFIDRSFGDNGTISFPSDTLESYSIIGADSLDNIYISHSKTNLENGLNSIKLIKLNQYGAILLNDKLIEEQDSIYTISIINNTLVRSRLTGGSTFINTYDLDFNPISRFIVPNRLYKFYPTDDGGLEGLTAVINSANSINNIFFKFNSDGLLDKDFGEDGLISFEYNGAPSQFIVVFDWAKKANNNILFTGYTADSLYLPITKLYTEDGQAIPSYGENNYKAHPIINEENSVINWAYGIEETKDQSNLIRCAVYDSSYNIIYYTTKVDNDGLPISSFGDNGYLIVQPTPNPITNPYKNNTCHHLGQFNNGDLLHTCTLYDSLFLVESQYLKLYNENGQEETAFGLNSRIELNDYPGEYNSLISPTMIKDDIFILKTDTIFTFIDSTNYRIAPTATYITKLSGEKILDYEPLSPPENIEFKLFPNPVTDKSIIQYNGPNLENLTLRIYNFSGQLIRDESISKLFNYQQIPINLSDASPGFYPVQIINNETEIWSTKIIIIK